MWKLYKWNGHYIQGDLISKHSSEDAAVKKATKDLNFVFAEIIKPNNGIEPYQVVKIQLRSLKNNDDPFKNAGIEQTWEFAHPNNKKLTGPLERFKTLLSSDSYKML